MSPYVELFKAVGALAWPLLTAIILWKLLPSIRKLVESRAFTLKIGGMEISAQEATDQIKAQLQDLKDQVIALKRATSVDHIESPRAAAAGSSQITILWVDDQPGNNALEISQLEARGYRVLTAVSTNDAVATLAREGVGLIISDMGRREDGKYVPNAGSILLNSVRENGHEQPFIVYSSAKYAGRNDAEVRASGGIGATASPTQLLEWIERYLPIRDATSTPSPRTP